MVQDGGIGYHGHAVQVGEGIFPPEVYSRQYFRKLDIIIGRREELYMYLCIQKEVGKTDRQKLCIQKRGGQNKSHKKTMKYMTASKNVLCVFSSKLTKSRSKHFVSHWQQDLWGHH